MERKSFGMESLTRFFYITVFFVSSFCFAQELKHDNLSGLNYIIREGKPSENIIILMHGYRSNENDLFSFASYFPNTTFICLQAPISYSKTSFAWYEIDFTSDGVKNRNMLQASENIEKIYLFLKNVRKNSIQKIILGGFSQGAIMSLKTAIDKPELIDGIICFSGAIFDEKLLPIQNKSIYYKNLNAFYGHGSADNVLPIQKGKECYNLLLKANIETIYKEYPMKHQISSQEIQDVIQWYKSNF